VAVYEQAAFGARFEWGRDGAKRLGPAVAAVVIVDVLTFSTTTTVAIERGAIVYPYQYARTTASAFAESLGASVAVHRKKVDEQHPFSLSPGSMRSARAGQRIVLPSPNGATITLVAADSGAAVYAGCLRNAAAVARAAASHGGPVLVIAAGERWRTTSGTLRPSFEDIVGAGAVLRALAGSEPSPEARAAIAAFEGVRSDLETSLLACTSGVELTQLGFSQDVQIAAELDVTDAVARLTDGAYRRI
jgi:2-phosphosulfolactate phosphatase